MAERAPPARVPFGRWFLACTLGEFGGFAAGGGVGFLTFSAVPDPTTLPSALALMLGCVGAGLVEGTVFGFAQWWALSTTFERLRARSYCAASASAAATGWFLGALPSTLYSLSSGSEPPSSPAPEPSTAVVLLASAAGGAVLGACFGAIQWRVLGRHARGGGSWVAANALGWALGLPWSFVAGSSAAAASLPSALAISAGAGLCMGATVALATGFALRRRVVPRAIGDAR